jgi:prepilin-type N-terminal cleavage/methylation domain-containing protein
MAARLRRLSSARGGLRRGYTLVEVVIAMLISSIMVTAMFGVALSQKVGTTQGDHRLYADQAIRQVSSQLRAYVTGCGCSAATGSCSSSGIPNDCTMILGPNTANAGPATWFFNSPSVTDSMGNVWALTNGTHVLTGVLPAWFEAAPYNARVSYVVTTVETINGRPVQSAAVSANWTEP